VSEDPRILELRRRVQADPASLAFVELAEELRRSGATDEAVGTCRAGLRHHPGNLTARVTLGRALIELGTLDEAFTELTFVLDTAPGNLPAIRALAEIYQRRGMMSEALVHYRRALQLTQQDSALEYPVERVEHVARPQPAPPPRIEELFDFDSLLAQLDANRGQAAEPFVPLKKPPESALDSITLTNDDQDAFALMERQLREREEQRLLAERQARQAEAERKRLLVLQELEGWLDAIAQDRRHHPGRSQPSA
jgi:tetratricopeptide (TPR) repeat protein